MGTRLIDLMMERLSPRTVSINGYICRVWFKGQVAVCNTWGLQGHKASDCPYKDKCRHCGENGHMVRHCTHAWGTNLPSASEPREATSGTGAADGESAGINPSPAHTKEGNLPPAAATSADSDPSM